MAALHATTITLRFFGDDLDPDDVSARLGCSPTFGAKKGGLWITKYGTEKVARTGFWRLVSENKTTGDLNIQISELLANCTDDLSEWTELTARFDASVFCGIFMLESNEGTDLSPENLKSLGLRNLRLSLDIYDPSPSD